MPFRKGSSLARAAALRGWALLLTTVEVRRLSASSVEASLARLSAILGDEDVDVRAAAGEAIALLYSTAGLEKMGEHAHSSSQGDSHFIARLPWIVTCVRGLWRCKRRACAFIPAHCFPLLLVCIPKIPALGLVAQAHL